MAAPIGWAHPCCPGRYEEAESVFREAILLDPAHPGAHNNLGNTLAALGRYEEAERVFREAIRLNPTHPAAHNNFGNTLAALGRYEEAEEALREAIRLDPTHPTAHYNLGELLLLMGEFGAARVNLEHAVELERQDAFMERVLLGVLLRRNDSSAAREAFAMALNESGTGLSEFEQAELRAIALSALDRADEAVQILREASTARLPSDRFRRPLYELLADPPLPGLDQLLAVWREIIAAHPDAIGLWGGPAEDTGPVHGT